MNKASVRVLQYNLPVKLVALDEGGYLATCQSLQGCLAEGDTASEAVSNIIDVDRFNWPYEQTAANYRQKIHSNYSPERLYISAPSQRQP
ncbi:MAG: hypothetical protein UV19_C0024G0007 [Parcubacteria group bacterium GW2011_GWA2_42_28]|nr:MAG: hypothetical protein UV19_C0024G0007 [Parcubacteria group bacterium GW2011_GWA2_42_28]